MKKGTADTIGDFSYRRIDNTSPACLVTIIPHST